MEFRAFDANPPVGRPATDTDGKDNDTGGAFDNQALHGVSRIKAQHGNLLSVSNKFFRVSVVLARLR